jgi:serine/threonine protein phosphatase 1
MENKSHTHLNAPGPPSPGVSTWKTLLFGPKRKELANIPAGCRVYAVGDIHGRLDLLEKLWSMIVADAEGVHLHKVIVFVGDYVDRGRDSKGVIDFLIHAKLKGGEVVCLRGNHDQSVLDFIGDANFYRAWRQFGAPETLLSYGVMPPRFDNESGFEKARAEFVQKCPPEHVKFFESLKYSHVIGGYVFVHAGVRPGIPLNEQDPCDLLCIRDEFLASQQSFEKVVVHGHTPQETALRRTNRIGIDTGAYATGRLSAVVLEGTECRFFST